MYRARFLKTFLKQETKLNADVKERVIEAVEGILSDPYSGLNLKGDLREKTTFLPLWGSAHVPEKPVRV